MLHQGQKVTADGTLHGPLPIYGNRDYVSAAGLLSYGPDFISMWRGAASYVDRILRGEKPADLSVQLPAKYETVLKLKTAKALGLDVPATVRARG